MSGKVSYGDRVESAPCSYLTFDAHEKAIKSNQPEIWNDGFKHLSNIGDKPSYIGYSLRCSQSGKAYWVTDFDGVNITENLACS